MPNHDKWELYHAYWEAKGAGVDKTWEHPSHAPEFGGDADWFDGKPMMPAFVHTFKFGGEAGPDAVENACFKWATH